jgi:hypothetical protein
MDTDMSQFQKMLLDEIVRLQRVHQTPRRLVLGRLDYEAFARLKKLYPQYPDPIRIEGREYRFGMEIIQRDEDRHFEILGDAA